MTHPDICAIWMGWVLAHFVRFKASFDTWALQLESDVIAYGVHPAYLIAYPDISLHTRAT